MENIKANKLIQTTALFTSASTLVCCALPALFVALGMGAAFAGLVGAVPQLVWFSEHKGFVFLTAGIFIGLSALFQYRARNAPCPVDRKLAEACARTRLSSKWIFRFSVGAYLCGVFFAFVAPIL